jgi:Mg2+-importing ATPase
VPSRPVLLATGAATAVGLLPPFGMPAGSMGMTSLPALYFAFLPLVLVGYCALLQAAKLRWTRSHARPSAPVWALM